MSLTHTTAYPRVSNGSTADDLRYISHCAYRVVRPYPGAHRGPVTYGRITAAAVITGITATLVLLISLMTLNALSRGNAASAAVAPHQPVKKTGYHIVTTALITRATRVSHAAHSARSSIKAYHTVRSGDTLTAIARVYYSDAGCWPGIYDDNTSTIGGNPDLIEPGQSLAIPVSCGASQPQSSQPAPVAQPVSQPAAQPVDTDDQPVHSSYSSSSSSGYSSGYSTNASYSGGSAFQQCVISRESGGNSQIWNASGHYGLYQFSSSTWAAYGGNPADFGHASVAEQNQVFSNAMATPGGASNWAPYDGC